MRTGGRCMGGVGRQKILVAAPVFMIQFSLTSSPNLMHRADSLPTSWENLFDSLGDS